MMKNTKKLLAMLLILALALMAMGCSGSNPTESAEPSVEGAGNAEENIGGANTDLSLSEETEPTETTHTIPDEMIITVAEQELYNDNGLLVTVPEQTLEQHGWIGDADGKESWPYFPELVLHVENTSENPFILCYLNVCGNGQLFWDGNPGLYNEVPQPGESFDSSLDVEIGRIPASNDGENKVTFTLLIKDDYDQKVTEIEVVIPLIIAEGGENFGFTPTAESGEGEGVTEATSAASEETTEAPEETKKETAYKAGTTVVLANDGYYYYMFEFLDGELVYGELDSDEGKGGWGGDTGYGIEKCPFYGMTVEEIVEKLEGENYEVTIQ